MRSQHPGRLEWARQVLAFAGLVPVTAGLALLPAAMPQASSHSVAASSKAASGPTTVTGTNYLWNGESGKAGKLLTSLPSVTVSQVSNLINQNIDLSWKNFTPSIENAGGPYYKSGPAYTYYAVQIAECMGADPASETDCQEANTGGAVENSDISPWDGQPNTVYAVTNSQGNGQANFYVENAQAASQLGCSSTKACSLVVVPGQGGLPPAAGSPAQCSTAADHTDDVAFQGGNAEPLYTFPNDITNPPAPLPVNCSWADRIVIPLNFDRVSDLCPSAATTLNISGSPIMADAIQQWTPALCQGSGGVSLSYTNTPETQAVQQAASGSGATITLTTRTAGADGFPTGAAKFVYAPVAVSAVSIPYWLDSTEGVPLSGLELNQDLTAKLLTVSYNPGLSCVTGVKPPACDSGISASNPREIFTDPEFTSLESSFAKAVDGSPSAQAPLSPDIPVQSDMNWTVTGWIHANSTANSFIQGSSDHGTTVNGYFKKISWPSDGLTNKDPNNEVSEEYVPQNYLNNSTSGGTVLALMALNEDPGASVYPTPQQCTVPSELCACPPQCQKDPAEPVGARSLIALMDEPDALRNGFPVASLANAAGKYVQPTSAGMAAALSHMISAGDGTEQMDFTNTDPAAYPLTMVIYAMVPINGLSHATAATAAKFLDFAAKDGQTPGVNAGQLPAGYLPLPKNLAAQTEKLAQEVKNQTGNGTNGNGKNGNGNGTTQPASGATATSAATSTPSPAAVVSLPSAHGPQSALLTAAHSVEAGLMRFALPALLILGGLGALGGSSAMVVAGGGEDLKTRLRRAGNVRAWPSMVRSLASRPGSPGRPPSAPRGITSKKFTLGRLRPGRGNHKKMG